MPDLIPETALNSHIAILGATGGGKSYTARGLVERLLGAGRRVCILDPVGVWWGLKAAADGEGPGLPVAVMGGEHGDLPISEGTAAPLAKVIASENLPAVIDTAEMGVAERNRFLWAFLAELYRLNRKALWLVLEEADEAAPQTPRSDGAPQLLDAVDRIARRGRSRGFRLLVVSQRPQVIHKNVLTQVGTMVAHRLRAPLDVKAVEDWMKANSDVETVRSVVSSLPSLETGEAWVWNPEAGVLERARMPLISTFDSSRTPGADEEPIEPVSLAEIDLGPLQDLAEPPDEDEKPAKTRAASPAELAAARDAGYVDGLADGAADERDRIIALLTADAPPAQAAPARPARPAPAKPTGDGLPAAAAKMLAVLDTDPPIRMTWAALAASIGNKARGGHFNTVRKALIEGGHVVEEDGLVRIAQPTPGAPKPASPAERALFLRSQWKSILGGRAAELIDVFAESPRSWSAAAGALACVDRGGHWNSARKALRDNGLVQESGGVVSLAEDLC